MRQDWIPPPSVENYRGGGSRVYGHRADGTSRFSAAGHTCYSGTFVLFSLLARMTYHRDVGTAWTDLHLNHRKHCPGDGGSRADLQTCPLDGGRSHARTVAVPSRHRNDVLGHSQVVGKSGSVAEEIFAVAVGNKVHYIPELVEGNRKVLVAWAVGKEGAEGTAEEGRDIDGPVVGAGPVEVGALGEVDDEAREHREHQPGWKIRGRYTKSYIAIVGVGRAEEWGTIGPGRVDPVGPVLRVPLPCRDRMVLGAGGRRGFHSPDRKVGTPGVAGHVDTGVRGEDHIDSKPEHCPGAWDSA